MIKIENVEVFGWEAAIRGMRNPKNSWGNSDSLWCHGNMFHCGNCPHFKIDDSRRGAWCDANDEAFVLGENDLKLMRTLTNAGDDHGKVIRFLEVYVDITAPLYWWKEFRTYRKGRRFMDDGDDFTDPDALEMFIETNSCSTMHKIHDKEFTLDDFSHEHLTCYVEDGELCRDWLESLECLIDDLNLARKKFLETKDKKYWWQMIQLLPSSYNQKRTVKLNYQVLKNMYHARKTHKLDEWREFCEWVETLPYFKEICISED